MGMREEKTDAPELTPEDQAALAAENRRGRAESEFVILLEDKKRVSADIEKIQKDIQNGKNAIEENNAEINRTNESILKVQGHFRVENQKLVDFLKDSESKKIDIENQIKEKEEEKTKILSAITALSEKHDLEIFSHNQEIKKLEVKLSSVVTEITAHQQHKINIAKDIEKAKASLEVLFESIQKLNEEKTSLDALVFSLKNEAENQRGVIQNNKTLITQQETKIADQNTEISVLNDKILEKEAEYKSKEAMAFAILQKQELLNNKEAFIKSQYERAGIQWDA